MHKIFSSSTLFIMVSLSPLPWAYILYSQSGWILLPLLAGNESLWTIVGTVTNQCSLPPLLVAAVDDVQDVAMLEGEALWGAVVILAGVVVKKGSVCTSVQMGVCVCVCVCCVES